jgi:BNR repeat-like domain
VFPRRLPRDGLAGRLLLAALALACLGAPWWACTDGGRRSAIDGPEAAAKGRTDGEPDKQWSGVSFAARTRVDPYPAASTESGFDAERVWSGEDDWEPFLAVDPGGAFVYQLTTRYVAPKYRIVVRRSSDGGATWEPDRLIHDSGIAQADPSATVAGDGTVFAVWLERWDTVLSRSEDHGDSWSEPVALNVGLHWSDYPSIAVSQDGADVYVAFNRSDSFVVASHDGGRTFSPPVQTNEDSRYWFQGAGAVGPNGEVFFGATGVRPSYRGRVAIVVLRSLDGGASWQTLELDTSEETPTCEWAAGCYQGFLSPVAQVAADLEGALLAVYNAGEATGSAQRIWARRSTDGGESWSHRRRLSRRSPKAHNAFSRVAAGPTAGDFRVIWQGTSGRRTDDWNTFYRRSEDGGASWGRRQRLSDQAAGAPYKRRRGYAFPYGDYLALAVDGTGENHVIWGEGASHNGPGGSWYTRGR